ncbi:MAG: methylenetetrahydrofolate--tRNA-(uracil(54)-C(5))-methyltransferase (FADH(2)-oxidizing) TrmFO [Planctomycetales bacterium]|nr:methylenetetrahydrofolate--tRNA-(uracil(54)-C(5))-methyltransferase (FADH(2)-oxidizing) TrmFO [bacterium]UNM07357.1 MAG: methylenetetrahydrofolate--tRNA-(uracil(54)-C(5))-methyltransferase (FADH(2)-oxidizing) TrmFO [Planctomycetales bacterium]
MDEVHNSKQAIPLDASLPPLIIGGGLSGCEAALQLSARGIASELWEMRPTVMTEAHVSEGLAELVCSNSFKSEDPVRAQGLLKLELDSLGCKLLQIARECRLPGGAALVLDREQFSAKVTETIEADPLVTLRRERFEELQAQLATGRLVIMATGPLTSDGLWQQLSELLGDGGCYFYDATSPVISTKGINHDVVFSQSRYDKGGGDDYLNCPFEKDEYEAFRAALLAAEVYPINAADKYLLFEGCLPIEELANRGEGTMRHGCLKPKGLVDPRTGRMPYAAVQLRWEDAFQNAMSLVGFQTRLRFGEQDRVFAMIPGLEQVKIMRYGRMHRNSYVEAPKVMLPTLQVREHPNLIITGQLTGLEGYMSAISTGLLAGINASRLLSGNDPQVPPEKSCLGAMMQFMVNPGHKEYRPTAFQYGMLKWLPEKIRRDRKADLIRTEAEAAWTAMESLASR